MKHGRFICDTLKAIRLDIARANGIEYAPVKCHHKGECAGTCPACESEMRYIEREIAHRRSLGKVALVAGVSLGLTNFSAMAGNSASRSAMMSESAIPVHESDTTKRTEIFGNSEQMPQFRGGYAGLMKYLQENVVYPSEAFKNNIQGRVVVRFIVDSLGYVGEVEVVRSVHELLDAEAVRVAKTLPRFSPGRSFGKAINVWYTLPVTFKLQEDNPAMEPVKGNPYMPIDMEMDDEFCYEEPDVMPEFPGGLNGLMNYLSDHIKYPKMADKGWLVQGRVIVMFVVKKTGEVGQVKVVESVDDDLAEEVVRVVKSLPDFTPGRVNDEPVNVWYTLPVNFKLPADD